MTVVAGYIPDRNGEAALAASIEEARQRGLRLVVVNATKGDAWVDSHFATKQKVADLEAKLGGLGIDHEIRQTDGPDIAQQILDVVRETNASLLVIGIRHRTAVGKMLMGSTAQTLLMDSPCPVLAVKAQ
jgi:nucleotide-binding universal stress UspA family protein